MSYVEDVARSISARFAAALGIPEPANAWKAFAAQVTNETAGGDPSTRGVRNNNPLNLTDPWPDRDWGGEVGTDEQFAVFGSLDAGVAASVQNLLAPSYEGIQNAFRFGDPVALAHAIEASPWDAGHYGYNLASLIPGPNDQPAAPGVAEPGLPGDTSCGAGFHLETITIGPLRYNRCVPNTTLPDAIKQIPDSLIGQQIGKSIDDFKTTIGAGARSFAIAGAVIGAVALLGYAGIKRTLD